MCPYLLCPVNHSKCYQELNENDWFCFSSPLLFWMNPTRRKQELILNLSKTVQLTTKMTVSDLKVSGGRSHCAFRGSSSTSQVLQSFV